MSDEVEIKKIKKYSYDRGFCFIDKDVHKRLKAYCFEKEFLMHSVSSGAVKKYLDKYETSEVEKSLIDEARTGNKYKKYCYLDKEIYKRIKIFCFKNDVSIYKVATRAIDEYLERNSKKRLSK